MPIYEYRCSACQQVFEEWVKHAEDQDVPHACPHCNGAGKRIISNTSFALKGTGWYTTEYGSRKNDPTESPKSGSDSIAVSPTQAPAASDSVTVPPTPTPAASASSEPAPACSAPEKTAAACSGVDRSHSAS